MLFFKLQELSPKIPDISDVWRWTVLRYFTQNVPYTVFFIVESIFEGKLWCCFGFEKSHKILSETASEAVHTQRN